MKKLTRASIAIAFAFTTNAYAAGFADRIASNLELTPEQTIQFTEVQTKRKAHLEDALKVREQIKALTEAGDVDGAAILAGQQAEKKVRTMYALKTELATFLTEEQMSSLAEVRKSVKRKKERLIKYIRDKQIGE